jgi:hypothetical protein
MVNVAAWHSRHAGAVASFRSRQGAHYMEFRPSLPVQPPPGAIAPARQPNVSWRPVPQVRNSWPNWLHPASPPSSTAPAPAVPSAVQDLGIRAIARGPCSAARPSRASWRWCLVSLSRGQRAGIYFFLQIRRLTRPALGRCSLALAARALILLCHKAPACWVLQAGLQP